MSRVWAWFCTHFTGYFWGISKKRSPKRRDFGNITVDCFLTHPMVQFTYTPPTLCKQFPTLKNNTELFSSCRNVCFGERNISSRGIFIWGKIKGDILDAGLWFGHKCQMSCNWCWKGSNCMLTDFLTWEQLFWVIFALKYQIFLSITTPKRPKYDFACMLAIFIKPPNDDFITIGSICKPKFSL